MASDPYTAIKQAQEQIVAGAMAGAYQLITSAIPNVTSIRMINNDEGSIYWAYRTKTDPDGEWIEIQDETLPHGQNLYNALYDETNGIGLTWLSAIEPYLLVQVGPEVFDYGPSMPVDKYDNELVHADLDPEKMRVAYQPYEKEYDEDLSKILLVYSDEYGELFEQPLSDITEAGTLICPETGDDLELVGWKRA